MTTTYADDVDVEVVPDTGGPATDLEAVEAGAEPVVQATVEFLGRRFPIRTEGVSLLALMKFATVAKRQQQRKVAGDPDAANDMDGLDALYALIRSCIAPEAWDEFEEYGIEKGAGADALMGVVRDAVQAHANRPTSLPSGSPGGPSTTGPSSAGGSYSPGSSSLQVQQRLEQRGRPDIARVVQIAREHGAAQ